MSSPVTQQQSHSAALTVPKDFASLLYGRTAAEDMATLGAHTADTLAESAFGFLCAARIVHIPSIRIVDGDAAIDPALAGVTILETINDDMPFLLDSTLAELGEQGLEIRLVAHPVFAVVRASDGTLASLENATVEGTTKESFIHIHISHIGDAERRTKLASALEKIYADVRLSVQDWPAMRARVEQAANAYRANPPPLPADDLAEAVQFLDWMVADNFTFLGAREYRFGPVAAGSEASLDPMGSSGLGILRDPDVRVLKKGRELVTITPEVLEFLHEPHALIITKANVKSRVHRRVHMDYVGVKLFSETGELQGELRLIGLLTSTAYMQATTSIPYIRHKVAQVLETAALDKASHSGKVLANVLETYPRDELFQVDVPTLASFAGEIASLYEHPRLKVLARVDRFDRFVSVMTFLPKDRYDTQVRRSVGAWLAKVYEGRLSASYPYYPEGPLVRTQFIIGRDEGRTPVIAQHVLETEIADLIRTWPDRLAKALSDAHGVAGQALANVYAGAFSAGYMDAYPVGAAIGDIGVLEKLSEKNPRAFVVSRGVESGLDEMGSVRIALKVFSRLRPMPLSERVPLLEHMGFVVVDERTFDMASGYDGVRVWLHDMSLERVDGASVDTAAAGPRIEAMLGALFGARAESDGYNALVLTADLGWRDIAMVRTLSRYLRQARIRFSQDYMWATLVRHSAITRQLVDLVYARFDPRQMENRSENEAQIKQSIEAALTQVSVLDEDRILRRFLNLIEAAVRTNFFQLEPDGHPRAVISFKFESHRIEGLPLPRPLYEITVYSPRVEGIHLRFGKVARGGLRWSDRPQDFRTEILGLVKAQQVKNAVIVPVGAKGGFVPKNLPLPSQRDAFMAEGIAAYKIFINALLDLTDNIEGENIVPPQNTLRHDGDDPYLVVAADKGTATFSDIANGLSLEHHHWLGDAFASGGSVGYDHKKMGITARGAWEAVKRHFREMDHDIQTQSFTVVGVGDMSGDVFGNGMLLSPTTRLVAAFDHRDIFLDPDPDMVASLAERQRLFALPRSSWQDYDKGLISAGGGVFSRSAKEIALSAPVRQLLGLEKDVATPQEVLGAILRAQADLLWFGGIGTYVRASSETDETVGDRANDSIRITGADLRCKVIGEGANLGMTQKGRIEAAQRGVRLNTDAIDNSAGVNTSDVEVNIKIALSSPVRQGVLDETGRNNLLASMTDEVGALVLRNNYQQTLALSLAQRRGLADMGFIRRLMQGLEAQGRLDRAVEYLPDDLALAARERAGNGLARPELAVLLAYAKLSLYDDLLASNVPDDPFLSRELVRYFPHELVEAFPDAIQEHRLRREIVATALANALINRGGPTLIARISDETGADAPTITRAFAIVRDVFGLTALNTAIDALDTKISGTMQLGLYADVQELMVSRLVWFIRNADFSGGLESVTTRFRQSVASLVQAAGDENASPIMPQRTQSGMIARSAMLKDAGVPHDLAAQLSALPLMTAAPDIVLVAGQTGSPLGDVAATFFAADESFGFGALIANARSIQTFDYYDRLALDRAIGQIEVALRRITGEICAHHAGGLKGQAAVEHWVEVRGAEIIRIRKAITEVASGGLTLSRLAVAASLAGDIVRG